MSDIKCPHCGQVFTVDESEYTSIVNQIKTNEFEEEVAKRLHELEATYDSKVKLSTMEARQEALQESSKELKDASEKITEYKSELLTLKAQLSTAEQTKQDAVKIAIMEVNTKFSQQLSEIQKQNELLQAQLQNAEQVKQDAVKLAVMDVEAKTKAEIDTLTSTNNENMRLLQEELDRYKDMKARMSTKMIGESLEQHCMDEFDKLRATAFVGDYFEKDNTVSSSGSKGDFIYRAYDADGNELVSIMFEMKNEADNTEKKHKNADFFKELDKDRNEKECEYAVLCSLLELDSELYNQGIVDVSHKYPKMFVVRPQFFIVIISLLRNAAKSQEALKHELMLAKRDDVDMRELEAQIDTFKTAFGKNFELASRKFDETIDEIDKAILHLQKTRDALTSCERNLRLANDKSQALTVKKLAKNSPGLLEQLD